MRDERRPERASRVVAAAGERATDQHDEAQRAADHEAGPLAEPARVHGHADDGPDEEERADALHEHPQPEVVREQRLRDARRSVVNDLGRHVVGQDPLGEERAEDAAGELHHDVDRGVDRADLADRGERDRDRRVEVRPRHHRERLDQHEEDEDVDQSEYGEVELHEQRHDERDEEDQRERADELRDVGRGAAGGDHVNRGGCRRLGWDLCSRFGLPCFHVTSSSTERRRGSLTARAFA